MQITVDVVQFTLSFFHRLESNRTHLHPVAMIVFIENFDRFDSPRRKFHSIFETLRNSLFVLFVHFVKLNNQNETEIDFVLDNMNVKCLPLRLSYIFICLCVFR